jgi:hypothetical protein
MLGTLVYMFLDVSFNTIIWTSQKAIQGGYILSNHILNNYYETNNNSTLMIEDSIKETGEYINSENNEPPTYNNTVQMMSLEDLNTIQNQINQQSKIIDELKLVLENQKKISNQ